MRLRVSYETPSELLEDHDTQMVKGGLLVRGDAPPGLTLYDPVELEVAAAFSEDDEEPVVLTGQVVQIIAGVGVAVVFDPAPLAEVVAAARSPRPVAQVGVGPPGGSTNEKAKKIQLALHGNKDDRARIIRDRNKVFHAYVLRNPQLGVDEVLEIAKSSTMAPETLEIIAGRKEWAQRADIAIALVRNPKTPAPTAVRLIAFISAADLRQLAKDTRQRPPVVQAARKRLFGDV